MEGGCIRWLNETYLESAIRSSENDQSVRVISSEVTSMAAPGSHFMSNMYRTTVHIKRESGEYEISLVVKVAPEKQELLQMTVNGDVFELELRLLRHISPEMHKLMQKLPSVNCQPFTPKYICSHSCPSAIIMEDLTKTGFRTPDRKQGLNYNHSSLVMKTLARYHAASVVLNGNSQHLLEIFKKKDPGLAFRSIIDAGSESGLKEIKKEIESWPGYEIYIDKIENMSRNSGDKWFAARSRFDGDFNVLIHGDLWLTNLMFKYSEDGRDPVDVRFIDFQFSYWTSPAVDLLYFLNSSTELGITDRHEELIVEYHRSLTDTLSFFGLPAPTLEELNNQMLRRSAIGLQTAIGFRSIVMADENQIPELGIDVKNEESVQLSESYKQALRVLLPVLHSRGWF